jgi:Ca2+-binding EF-hand superfamily protein
VSQISLEKQEELREIFSHFDKNNDGVIESSEFAQLLEALGAEMSESEVATGLRALDEDGSGTIEFEEFAAWWTSR